MSSIVAVSVLEFVVVVVVGIVAVGEGGVRFTIVVEMAKEHKWI